MQELFEMIFDCVEYACCYIETERWKWLKTYFCDFDPEEVKESIPILLDTEEVNPLSLKNGRILTDKEIEEIKIAKKINDSETEDQKPSEIIELIGKIDYGWPPEQPPTIKCANNLDSPDGLNGPESPDEHLPENMRNITYFDHIEMKTISKYPTATIILIFVLFLIVIMRFRKSKNVILKIISRSNNNAKKIFRNFCSTLSAK